jgi:outer membrane protein
MRKSILFTTFLFSSLVISGAVRAETLESTFEATLATNPQLESAAFGVAGADARVAQAKAAFMPTVTASAGYGFNRYDATGLVPQETQRPWNGGVSLTLPLYTGGRLTSQLSQARAQGRASEYQQALMRQSVLFSSGNAFLKVSRAEKALELARAQEALLSHELAQAQAELAAGLRTKTDVSQAEARLAGAKALVRNSEATLNTARFEFSAVVGREPEGTLLMPNLPEPGNRGAFLAQVHDQSPQALASRASIEAAAAGLENAKAAYRPTLSLQMGLSHDEQNNPMLPKETNRTIGLQLTIPLYTGGMAHAVKNEASAKLSAAKSDAEYVDTTLQSEAASAWEMLDSDNAQIEARRDQVTSALTAAEGAHTELKAGTRTLLDVLNAEQEALDAQINLLNATFDRTSAILRLQALAGTLGQS